MELPDLLSRLVAINSINPTLVAGAPGERALADFVSSWLTERGIAVAEVPADGAADRPSLLARIPGRGAGRNLALYAHLDTVGVGGAPDLLAPRRDGNRLRGRGAYDMKGSLAAFLRVVTALAAAPCAGDVWLMAVADEEAGSLGTEAVLRELARRGACVDGALIAEPSDLRLMLGHRGFATGVISTRGRAAHTARRDQGVDAIAMMARILVAVEDLDGRLNAGPGHPLLGHSAVVASLVRGGSELFTYPDACEAEFVWRMLPGQTRAALTAEVEAIFAALRARDGRFDGRLTWRLWREPMLLDPVAPIAAALTRAAESALGGPPEVCAAPWWTDAALFQAAGIPAAIFGPSGGGIHADDEWVDLDGLALFERAALAAARSFCG